jgi:hypothetical protein
MGERAVVAQSEELALHLPAITARTHENPQAGKPVSGPRFGFGTSYTRSRIVTR